MNKGDTVVYAQRFDPHEDNGNPDLIEVTFERAYEETALVTKNGRHHLVGVDTVFSDMPTAVKAFALQSQMKATIAESRAKHLRWIANNWLLKLKDFD
jgi:hypothetical protein